MDVLLIEPALLTEEHNHVECISTFEDQMKVLMTKGPKRISPFFIPMLICDMSSGLVAMRLGLKGPNYAATSACASATHAMSDAYWVLRRGEAEAIITGGSEDAICEISWAAFCAEKAMSPVSTINPLRPPGPSTANVTGSSWGRVPEC